MTVALLLKFSFAFEFIEVVRPVIVYTPSPSAGGRGGTSYHIILNIGFWWFTEKSNFRGGLTKSQYRGGGLPKKGGFDSLQI